jgi:adenylate cyclase
VIHPEATEVSCFFSDLEGFTSLSEKLGPGETVRFLNIYLEHISEILDAHEAFINKFQGDGIFAFFNPPLNPQKDHARRACLAAIDSQLELSRISKELRLAGIELELPLHMRIGIGTGPAVVGDCGSERKFDYTCLGDTVNFASRLESANKCFGSRILISEKTFETMGTDLLARLLGKIHVAGRRQPIVVYELIGYREDFEDKIAFVELFDRMVKMYWQNKLAELPAMLDKLESLHPGDKAVGLYRTMLEQIKQEGSQLWQDGVIDCDTK